MEPESAPPLVVGPLKIDVEGYAAWLHDRELRLTNKEFGLLLLLASRPGRVLRRDVIAREVWGGAAPGRTIDIHVARLRRKLPSGAIQTFVRVGYRLTLA